MKVSTALPATITAVSLLLGSALAEAKIVCWKDNEGVRNCGNAVPPEYAQQGSTRLNKQGVTIKKTARAKTAEELRAEREAKRKQAEEDKEKRRIASEQARKDRVLLQTYNSEDELELARDGKLAVIDSRMKHNRQVVAKLQGSLETLQEEAAGLERGGKKIPDKLRKEMTDIQKRIDDRHKLNARYTKEQGEVRETFAADIQRYHVLKGAQNN